ncbi:MAG: RagB/SusD family nutrient uptake outer membrane protein [Prevotella sp.]|nr:RagB/SusD family nutrient uptake outer membrane protein [Prevotella sp.]
MKLNKYIITLSVALCAMLSGCTDWLDTQPNDKQSEEQQFSTKDGFYSAVNGVYNRMSGSNLYGKTLSYGDLDLLGQYYIVEQSNQGSYYKYLRALTNWDYTEEGVSAVLSSTWNEAYSTIMNINVVLNNIEKDATGKKVLPQREYKMLKGEMLAARAMIHFDMLRWFGPIYSKSPEGRGIPYNDTTEPQILTMHNAKTALNDYILRDLKEAENLLAESDPVITEGPRAEYDEVNLDNSMRYRQLRLNYYATVLLTARAYLWGDDVDNALAEAQKLTEDAKVKGFFPAVDKAKLLGNYNDPDRMFSTESLFGYYNKNRGLIYDGTFGGSNTGTGLLIPRSGYVDGQLFGSVDAEDIRYKSQWELGETLEGQSSMKLTKFKDINDAGKNNAENNKEDETGVLQVQKFYGTYCSLIKLSEAYYIAAECMMRNGNLAEAWNYLNTVRENRGLGSYPTTTAEKTFWNYLTLDYIREFVGEGQKFFYFKRRNMGFDNAYNGRKEIKVLVSAGFPPFIPPTYSYEDKATDAEKEKRFVAPLPQSELDNR